MNTQQNQERMTGLILFLVGAGVAVYLLSEVWTAVPILTAIFGLLAFCGVLFVRGWEKTALPLLGTTGILALAEGVRFYLNAGLTILTALCLLIGCAGVAYSVRAYRVME